MLRWVIFFSFVLQNILSAKTLEVRVWYDEDIFTTEQEIVRKIQVNPQDAFAHYMLSVLKAREFAESPDANGLQHLAIQLAQQCIDLNPDSDLGYLAMVNVLDQMGRSKQAVALMNRILNSGHVLTWRYYHILAKLSGDLIETDRSLPLLYQALAMKDAQSQVILPLMIALIQNDTDDRRALLRLKELKRQYPDKLIDYYLAVYLAKLAEYQVAYELFDSLSKHDQFGTEARLNASMISYQFLSQPQRAQKLLQSVIAEKDLQTDHKSAALAHLGVVELVLKNNPQAQDYFLQSILISDSPISATQFMMTQTRQNNASHINASILEQLLTKVQPSGLYYALLGEAYAEDMKDFPKAAKAFQDSILLNPERADFRSGLGVVYYRMKHFEKAGLAFQAAVQLDPSDAISMYNLACILAIRNQAREAMQYLEESLSLDPSLIEIARSDNDLQVLVSFKGFKELLNKFSPSH